MEQGVPSQQGHSTLKSVVHLGIGNNLLDTRWGHKYLIPGVFASIPMLVVYIVNFGVIKMLFPCISRVIYGKGSASDGFIKLMIYGSNHYFLPQWHQY